MCVPFPASEPLDPVPIGIARCLVATWLALAALGSPAIAATADVAPDDLKLLERAARLGATGQQEAEQRGEALDVDALRTMFERGEADLVTPFARGMKKTAQVSLPPDVENLLVERFEQRKLVDTVLSKHLAYRSRALFDLLHARLQREAPSKDASVMLVLDTHQPGVEEHVLAIADRLPPASLARFMADRRIWPSSAADRLGVATRAAGKR